MKRDPIGNRNGQGEWKYVTDESGIAEAEIPYEIKIGFNNNYITYHYEITASGYKPYQGEYYVEGIRGLGYQKDVNVQLSYVDAQEGGIITDSWSAIIDSVNNGTYKDKYRIGDTKALDLGSEGVVEMQIVAFDADELADGSGTAAITWISKQLINSDHRMNPFSEVDPSDSSKYLIGTGSIGGWANSEIRSWLQSDVKALIPSTVRNAIKPVTKYSTSWTTANPETAESRIQNESSVDDVWIPSWREVFGSDLDYIFYYQQFESSGPTYTIFDSDDDRVKQKPYASNGNGSWWWLRSVDVFDYYSTSGDFRGVGDTGINGLCRPDIAEAVALGFCI